MAALILLALAGVCAGGVLREQSPGLPALLRVRRGGLVGSYGNGVGPYSGLAGGAGGSYGAGGYGGGGGGGHLVIAGGGGGSHGPSAADLAQRAAGVAVADAGYQQQAAWNAAQAASQQVAAQAAQAAHQAQAAAAAKYAQAQATTQAAQAAAGAAFAESANAAKAAKTVQSAEAFKQWALDQVATLSRARNYAEGNVGLTNNVLTASLNALGNQRAMEWSAYSAAGSLAAQEGLAFDDLNSAQQAANKASSAAKTAYLRAKGTGHGGLGYGTSAGSGSGFGFGGGGYGGGGGGYGH
ncbi:uncharacterized protein [Penaeus vannamei]|uniref:uncharacterized protein n=1 Tax=Penaeus vannamei TaxID=6689 RepID=UPI00387F90CD